MNWLLEPFYQHLCDLGWRDVVEIIFFSLIVYGLQLWLRHDTQKPLLGYWYTYCGLWIGASFLDLSTITLGLLVLLPATITLFALIHQRTLQKNYLALRTVHAQQPLPDNWLDVLMQTALININRNTSLYAVIEHQDSLETMLTTSLPLHATLKKELLVLLLDSVTLDNEKYFWVTTRGLIRGINATWSNPIDAINTPKIRAEWQQDALFFTAVTDAIVLHANCTDRTFTIVAKGAIVENMTAHNAQRYIKNHYLAQPSSSAKKEESIHGSYRAQTDHKQQSVS